MTRRSRLARDGDGRSWITAVLLAPLRTSVLAPLIGVLAVATTWFGLYLAIIARWTP